MSVIGRRDAISMRMFFVVSSEKCDVSIWDGCDWGDLGFVCSVIIELRLC